MACLVLYRNNVLPEGYAARTLAAMQIGDGSTPVIAVPFTAADEAKPVTFIVNYLSCTLGLGKVSQIVVLGGYFGNRLEGLSKFISDDCHVVVIRGSDDGPECVPAAPIRTLSPTEKLEGPMHLAFKYFCVFMSVMADPVKAKIIGLLSQYHYGAADAQSLAFHYGLRRGEDETVHLQNLLALSSLEEIARCTADGEERRTQNAPTVAARCKQALEMTISGLRVLSAFGDSPILDTLMELARQSPSGVAILLRYNFVQGKTFASVMSSGLGGVEGLDAPSAAKVLRCALENAKRGLLRQGPAPVHVSGGGSAYLAGGNIDSLLFPASFCDPDL